MFPKKYLSTNCEDGYEKGITKKVVYGEGLPHMLTDFGNSVGSFFLIASFPLLVLYNFMICCDCHCSFFRVPCYKKFVQLSTWFEFKSFIVFTVYVLVLTILCAIPIGGEIIKGLPTKNGKRLQYNMNGGFISTAVLGTLVIVHVIGLVDVANYIDKHLFHFCIYTYIFGFILAVFLHITSYSLPETEINSLTISKRGTLYGFFVGRQYNPRILGVDFKMLILRFSLIVAIILILSYSWIQLESKLTDINTTFYLFIIYATIYIGWGVVYESSWVSSLEVSQEGFGYIHAIGYSIYPYTVGQEMKYLTDTNLKLPIWMQLLSLFIFIIGLILFDGGNRQKDTFRRFPTHPSVVYLNTMSTKRGTKLLISGYWGFVRHPNYLGDILINIAFLLVLYHTPLSLYFYGTFGFLIHRTTRDHQRCKKKYGADWDKYCHIVKYALIPYVY